MHMHIMPFRNGLANGLRHFFYIRRLSATLDFLYDDEAFFIVLLDRDGYAITRSKRGMAGGHGLFDVLRAKVFLPFDTQTHLIAVTGDFEPPTETQIPSRTLLSCGSSITFGGNGVLPSETYPKLLAKSLGRDGLNFGMAGSARLEPELAT